MSAVDTTGQSQLVIVSNRLPLSGPPRETEVDSAPPGGLIAALSPVMRSRPGVWVGWGGDSADRHDSAPAFRVGTVEYRPISLNRAEREGHYEGFSNQTIWPLYHDVGVAAVQRESWWETHQAVTRKFAEAVAQVATPGALVWVHDYQLQLLPALLAEARPDLTIGYFHHIPFPTPEVFGKLHHASEILEGLAAAHLVGFQRTVDAQHFQQAAKELVGRSVPAGVYPISVDCDDISRRARHPDVVAAAAQIRADLGNPERIFLGVDRLDYTKGIPQRLLAFEAALHSGALDSLRHCFVQLASPSREAVSSYQKLREEVEAIVARINARFGSPASQPVVYRSENLSPEAMLAHYLAADVMVVSALRDGMNLVAKEYVAVRHDQRGVLVLSRHAGAADELREALLVDPENQGELTAALVDAATMEPAEQTRRMSAMRAWLSSHDVAAWATHFLSDLSEAGGGRQ